MDISGCSKEDKEEIKDYQFCFINLNNVWFSWCYGSFACTSSPFLNKNIVKGANIIKATGTFRENAKKTFEDEIPYNIHIKEALEKGLSLVYSANKGNWNYYYDEELKCIWYVAKDREQCCSGVFGNPKYFTNWFKKELIKDKTIEGGLTALGFKILKENGLNI